MAAVPKSDLGDGAWAALRWLCRCRHFPLVRLQLEIKWDAESSSGLPLEPAYANVSWPLTEQEFRFLCQESLRLSMGLMLGCCRHADLSFACSVSTIWYSCHPRIPLLAYPLVQLAHRGAWLHGQLLDGLMITVPRLKLRVIDIRFCVLSSSSGSVCERNARWHARLHTPSCEQRIRSRGEPQAAH